MYTNEQTIYLMQNNENDTIRLINLEIKKIFASIPNRTSKPNLQSQWKTETTYGMPISSNHPKMML
ncbi:hypothetical protein [Flavobacterium hibernum]|uniref:Uncharacterized protein n=1 Tax=Flavobacterium hibernum TaxID=37752 RepID=A0A0D0F483_9FLAO|nr:hypothetical protein [Flavobacterium hibernum]KIO54456.1 hypothetical protein IW18_03135 [Flavobacterium hibernum]PTT00421.1 hypothetical protein DBR27_12740 [Flavobacterium sp. HMWF030]STO10683.1 Uncharacterised protein [Flavobacterium hibernum]